MCAHFQTFTPNYENISNRMSRLKQHGHSQSGIIRSSSNRKVDINVFSVESGFEYKPKRRLSPTSFTLN